MDLQYHGANCLTITTKKSRVTIDDNLDQLGLKSVSKSGDIILFTHEHNIPNQEVKLLIDSPGEYEVSDVSVQGMAVKAYISEEDHQVTLYKLIINDISCVITGHISPDLSEADLESIGTVDVLCIPVGGRGYTLNGTEALKVIKKIEPKLIIPTHYRDKAVHYTVEQDDIEEAINKLAMEPKATTSKLSLKSADLADVTQLIVLEKS